MTQFKFIGKVGGGHTHISVWVRTLPTETWAKSGDIVLDNREWRAFFDAHQGWPGYFLENRDD